MFYFQCESEVTGVVGEGQRISGKNQPHAVKYTSISFPGASLNSFIDNQSLEINPY